MEEEEEEEEKVFFSTGFPGSLEEAVAAAVNVVASKELFLELVRELEALLLGPLVLSEEEEKKEEPDGLPTPPSIPSPCLLISFSLFLSLSLSFSVKLCEVLVEEEEEEEEEENLLPLSSFSSFSSSPNLLFPLPVVEEADGVGVTSSFDAERGVAFPDFVTATAATPFLLLPPPTPPSALLELVSDSLTREERLSMEPSSLSVLELESVPVGLQLPCWWVAVVAAAVGGFVGWACCVGVVSATRHSVARVEIWDSFSWTLRMSSGWE